MTRGQLGEREGMLAGEQLLLPCLDGLLARRREGTHDAVDKRFDAQLCGRDCGRVGRGNVHGLSTGEVPAQGEDVLVLVLLTLLYDRELRHLRRGLSVVILWHWSGRR